MPREEGGAEERPASTASMAFQASLFMESIMSSSSDCSLLAQYPILVSFLRSHVSLLIDGRYSEGTYDWCVLKMLREQRILGLHGHCWKLCGEFTVSSGAMGLVSW